MSTLSIPDNQLAIITSKSGSTFVTLPVPIPGPNEVLIKTLAGGVCHSDVGILDPQSNLNQLPPGAGCTLGAR